MTAPKPTRQPNKLHQQILGSLLANKSSTPLAANVSEASMEQAAKRWIK